MHARTSPVSSTELSRYLIVLDGLIQCALLFSAANEGRAGKFMLIAASAIVTSRCALFPGQEVGGGEGWRWRLVRGKVFDNRSFCLCHYEARVSASRWFAETSSEPGVTIVGVRRLRRRIHAGVLEFLTLRERLKGRRLWKWKFRKLLVENYHRKRFHRKREISAHCLLRIWTVIRQMSAVTTVPAWSFRWF